MTQTQMIKTVQTWEDDPGEPPVTRTPIQRAAPDVGRPPLPVAVAGPLPTQNGDYPGTPEFRYWAAADALSRAAVFWGGLLPGGTRWHSTVGPALTASLDFGDDLNAYYDRQGVRFFMHTVSGITVYSGESPDVVCHETGHAVLDALRPQLWDAGSAEVAALHESFGDMSAILSALSVGSLVDAILVETQGNPARSSRLSRLAEELGWAIRQIHPSEVDPDCLRNAANSFFYQDPVTLPPIAPASQLSSEPHYFSRIFTGAFLEALAGIFQQQPNRDSAGLAQAGQIMGRLLVAGLAATPVVPAFFAEAAAHVIAADHALNGGAYGPALRSAFVRHGILSPTAAASVSEAAPQHAAAITGPEPVEPLATVTVPPERYGLTEEFSVPAPAHAPRFGVTGADPAIGSLPASDYERVVASFVEDLFRQGRVAVSDEFRTPTAALVDGGRTPTHHITRADSGGLTLQRLVFT